MQSPRPLFGEQVARGAGGLERESCAAVGYRDRDGVIADVHQEIDGSGRRGHFQ